MGGVGKRRVELPEAGALLQYGGDGHHLPGRSRRLPRHRRAHYLPPVPTGGMASGEQGLVRGLAGQRAAVLRRPQRPGHHRSGAHTRKQSQRHPLVHGHRVPRPLAPPPQPDYQGQRDGQENSLRHHRGTPAGHGRGGGLRRRDLRRRGRRDHPQRGRHRVAPDTNALRGRSRRPPAGARNRDRRRLAGGRPEPGRPSPTHHTVGYEAGGGATASSCPMPSCW